MRNPITFILILFFTVVNVLDIITTFFIYKAESNPLFNWIGGGVGGLIFLVIYKLSFIGIVWAMYYYNAFKSRFEFFIFVLIMVLSILLISMAVYSNIYGMLHKEVLEIAASVPPQQRVTQYFSFVSIVYVLPMILCILAYWLHEKGFKHIKGLIK
jgi:hypothetical protein